jgi:hypothetical protein
LHNSECGGIRRTLLYPDMSKPPYADWNKIHDILQEKGYFDTFTEQRNKHPEPVDLLSILREDCYTNDDINKQAGIISRKE